MLSAKICVVLVTISTFRLAETAPTFENEDEVIFEKVLDEQEKIDGTGDVVTEEPPVCEEAQTARTENGGQCLDLLAALHTLLTDDIAGASRKEPEIRFVRNPAKRAKRSVHGQVAAAVMMEEINGTSQMSDVTNSTPLENLFDFPIDNEESIFIDDGHQRRNDSLFEQILIRSGIVKAGNQNRSSGLLHYALPEIPIRPLPELPIPNIDIGPKTNSSTNSTSDGQSDLDESVFWEIATLLGYLNFVASNESTQDNFGDPGLMDRIETVLGKILPLLAHMKVSIRKTGLESAIAVPTGLRNSSKGQSIQLNLSHRPPFVPFIISINATGPTVIGEPATHTQSPTAGSSTDVDPGVLSRLVVEPREPENSAKRGNTTASATTLTTDPAVSGTGPVTSTQSAPKMVNSRMGPRNGRIVSEAKNLPNHEFLKEKLLERAPHFLPQEQSSWWKAEQTRQQACILLTSLDVIRQKCCMTLPLVCPEFTAAVHRRSERLINSGSNANIEGFERLNAYKNGQKRGRQNEGATKDALIADTLARISSLLSVLIRSNTNL